VTGQAGRTERACLAQGWRLEIAPDELRLAVRLRGRRSPRRWTSGRRPLRC